MKAFMLLLVPFVAMGDIRSDVEAYQLASKGLVPRINLLGAHNEVSRVAQDLENGKLRQRVQMATDAIIRTAGARLRDKGFVAEANTIESEWAFVYMPIFTDRDIGDHKPLSDWLAKTYDAIEAKLGIQLCTLLHLSDLKTINFGIPVVFDPCNAEWDMVEYAKHFVGDEKYFGLAPVITYWCVSIACTAATWGAGIGWLCGPLGSGAELVMARFIAPKLSDRIYTAACKK
jgi:hypothetical protein